MKKAVELHGKPFLFFGSAWSAPSWMKIDGNKDGYFSRLKKDMYQVWADYHKKFIDVYKEHGIVIWGITTGNEPTSAFVTIANINRLGWMPDLAVKYC